MTKQIPQQRLPESQIAVPPSEPPSLVTLNERVSQVRRRRKFVRASGSVVIACLASALVFWIGSVSNEVPGETQVAVSSPTGRQEFNDFSEAPEETTRRQPRIQLYANLVDAVPVFDFDKETKAIHHVGWVESEQRVPVDMNYVPQQQQETFNAVLSSKDAWDYSL